MNLQIRYRCNYVFKKNKLCTFVNAYSYLKLRCKKETMRYFDEVYLDGILLVWVLRLLGKKAERFSFDMTSIAPLVFKKAMAEKLSLSFIGAREEEINKAKIKIKGQFADLKIISARNGYFKNRKEREEYIREIAQINPDIVIVGMGAPKQEEFLISLRKKGWNGTGFTCGGFFHQTTVSIQYYPKVFDKLHLRWVYRIYKEPKLLKRYFVWYPLGVFLFIKDCILGRA